MIREKILGVKEESRETLAENIPVRPPVMCPGCPHRGLFYILGKLQLNVSGDIGCYTLGALPPSDAMDSCICMGASIGMAHGMANAKGEQFGQKTVAVLGDSTFIHSGITGLIDIVYNKGTATVIILDNSTTGMTGHQHNPATGYTIKGEVTRQVDLVKLAQAVGVERVRIADPFDIAELEKIVQEEIAAAEPSVIISQSPCALLKDVKPGKALKINPEKCKKCRKCLAIGCPAIVDQGDFMEVNEVLCTGCGLCTKVCNFKAFETATGEKAGDING